MWLHVGGQAIVPSLLVTDPLPPPLSATVRMWPFGWGAGPAWAEATAPVSPIAASTGTYTRAYRVNTPVLPRHTRW